MIEIIPTDNINGAVSLPGSKYIANRIVLLAAMSKAPCRFSNLPVNEDINIALTGLQQLGVMVEQRADDCRMTGRQAFTLAQPVNIFSGASGTFSRFVLAFAALFDRPITISGNAKMNTRPVAALSQALRQLGAQVNSDTWPVTVTGPLKGGECIISGAVSSQFISALLLVAPYAQKDVVIRLSDQAVSKNYILMTLDLMARFGVTVKQISASEWLIPAGQHYQSHSMKLEPDPVSASYFMATAAICNGQITIDNFNPSSTQKECQFYRILEQMGCKVALKPNALTLYGAIQGLKGIEVDLSDMPDVAQTLAVTAAFAKGTTHITHIAHLAFKESNRIVDTAHELAALGIKVETTDSTLTIHGGGAICGAQINTHDDHRMAMSMALIGLRIPGVKIKAPQVAAKSFPLFWEKLEGLGVKLVRHSTTEI